MEQAYSNPDWAEFYDLWLAHLFGNGPAEDAVIFAKALKDVLADVESHSPRERATIRILDVGSGSGRVVTDLKDYIGSGGLAKDIGGDGGERLIGNLNFRFTLLEPSSAMLDRARRRLEDADTPQACNALPAHSFEYMNQSAAQIDDVAGKASPQYDFVIFAASGLNHLTERGEMQSFLSGLRRVLDPKRGRAVISILNEFLYDGDASEAINNSFPNDGTVSQAKEEARILSKARANETYVKYPTTHRWHVGDRSIRTDEFVLVVEDASTGEVRRDRRLGWDVKFLRVDEWERMLVDTGLEIVEKQKGYVQIWWTVK